MKADARLLQRLEPAGLRLAPSQVWAGIRLVPVLRDTLRLVPLSGQQWAAAVLVPIVAVSWIELRKVVRAHP